MSFFKNFSILPYKFDELSTNSKIVTNILTSAKFLNLFPEKSNNFYVDYIVKDGEKPEHIADRVYGKSTYHWIILMSNQIYNPYFDWPLSDHELEEYILNKYKGIAIFFDCVGESSSNFTINNSTNKLNTQKSNFVINNTITQNQNITTVTGKILEWDATYRKLIVDDIEGGMFNENFDIFSTNIDGVTFKIRPRKIVLDNTQAVNHFVDDFNNYLDPYGKINYYEYDDNKIFVKSNVFYNNESGLPNEFTTGATGSNDFMLNKYVNGTQSNVITNRRYEEIENQIKRTIKILKPEYAEIVVKQIENIFK